jgi:hypothetical protein
MCASTMHKELMYFWNETREELYGKCSTCNYTFDHDYDNSIVGITIGSSNEVHVRICQVCFTSLLDKEIPPLIDDDEI